MALEAKRERLLRIKEVLADTGLSRSTAYELMRRGEFPRPIELVGKTRCWIESEVDGWIAGRIDAACGRAGAAGGAP